MLRINQVLTTKQRRNTRETYLEMNLLEFFFKHTQVLDVCNVNVSVVEIEQLEDDNRMTTKQSLEDDNRMTTKQSLEDDNRTTTKQSLEDDNRRTTKQSLEDDNRRTTKQSLEDDNRMTTKQSHKVMSTSDGA